jgi:G3E family GTPase
MTRAHVITGSFGAGKTTAIRRLMSDKPRDELWVVILNEFTDAGLDALRVAESAQGQYDVRLVAGGCLCCVGELEFGKQVRDILRNLAPCRLLIEPSGAAHAGDIIDELARYEAQSALSLDSVVCLVDPIDATRIRQSRAPAEWSQIQSADVLLLSKPDLADAASRQSFDWIVAQQFPAKQFVASCSRGELPPEAMGRYQRTAGFSLLQEAAGAAASSEHRFAIALCEGRELQSSRLGLSAVVWILPQELLFARAVIEPRMQWLLEAYGGALRRLKGVLKTGPGPAWYFQSHGRGLASEDSAYRRDSRIEMLLDGPPTGRFLEDWRSMLRDAAEATLKRGSETSR